MNPEQCRNHVLNKSGSKYAYKFGKSNRFNKPVLMTHSMYSVDIPIKNQKKGCGFGFGDRPSLVRKAETPSPQSYDLPSSITKNSKSFGSSRKNTIFRWFLQAATNNASRPGPDAYSQASSLGGRKYSLAARLPTDVDIKLRKRVPAPNKYYPQNAGSPASGKYASSQFKNARKIIFFGRQNYVQKSLDVGPGSYNISQNYESLDERKFRGAVKTFGSADRPGPEDKTKRNFPGPGFYETFSQFPIQILS